jgi:hypothetical protein
MTQLSARQMEGLVLLELSSPLQPYPLGENVFQKVLGIAGSTVDSIESRIDASLASEPDLTDFHNLLHQRRSQRLRNSLTGWDDVTFYGSVIDELLRTERNKLRLSLLSSVVHQNHLVHATVVGPWIPATILENPNPPASTLKKLSDEFFHNLQRALPSIGFEHVFFVGFTELSKQFGAHPDDHDVAMAEDWYLRRGEIYWETIEPTWPQYALHAHLIGGAVQFQNYADAAEIDEAFGRLFPERWAVRVDPWIGKRETIQNVAGLGNYLWKIGPHRQCNPHRPMPPADEIRANARFWNVVGHHRRNVDLNGYWPEIGPRRLPLSCSGSLTRLDAMRRQLAWDVGLRIWTADDFEPDAPGDCSKVGAT